MVLGSPANFAVVDTFLMADGSARILLVDDEHAVQKLLSYPLRKEGYDVVPAHDGREALDRFAEQRFDLNE